MSEVTETTKEKLQSAILRIKNTSLVGCVKGAFIIGMPVCPLIDLCPIAPKKEEAKHGLSPYQEWDLLGKLSMHYLGTYYNTDMLEQDEDLDKAIQTHIAEVLEKLEKAEWVTNRCPLRTLLEK